MTEEELLAQLHALGIQAETFRALLVLPLIQVAWADGRFQAEEAAIVRSAAQRHGLVEGAGAELVERWIAERPSDATFLKARLLLVSLLQRHQGIAASLEEGDAADVIALCEQVAEAAGGLFGLAFRVEASERDALWEIAEGLAIGPTISWDQLATTKS